MKWLLLVAVLLAFTTPALAEDVEDPTKFKVWVDIDVEEHTSIIQSYINRELRSFGDVEIVGKNEPSNFAFRLLGWGNEYGIHIFYVFAVNIASFLVLLEEDQLYESLSNIYKAGGDGYPHGFGVSANISLNELKTRCEILVAMFDSQTLEQVRQERKQQ